MSRAIERTQRFSLSFYVHSSDTTQARDVLPMVGSIARAEGSSWTRRAITASLTRLSFRGPAVNIDSLHTRLRSEVLDPNAWILISDELGDRIRHDCYLLLSQIECELREFVKRAMIQVVGPNWWEDMLPLDHKSILEGRRKSGGSDAAASHVLDFADFDFLINLFSMEYSEWPSSRFMSVGDLESILKDATSIQELHKTIATKQAVFSLWNNAFAPYFADAEAWRSLEKTLLAQIIPLRNRVMHHRRVQIHDRLMLRAIGTKALKLIRSARPAPVRKPTNQERDTAKAAMQSTWLILASQQQSAVSVLQNLASQVANLDQSARLKLLEGVSPAASAMLTLQSQYREMLNQIYANLRPTPLFATDSFKSIQARPPSAPDKRSEPEAPDEGGK